MKIAKWFITITILAAVLLSQCTDDSPDKLPSVTTISPSKIFETSVLTGGNVDSEGGSTVTARGVCWSTSSGPTTADSHDEQGTGPGRFQSILVGLTPTTYYFVRAYATNTEGTAYGDENTFKTLTPFTPPETETILDQEGNANPTRKIGTQTWMAQNLKTTTFADGSPIPVVRQDSWYSLTTPACCWVQNDDSRTIAYGTLYNFYAVSDPRNVCPNGWHVPSRDEWKAMADELGGNDIAGGKLKETGTAHWMMPNEGASNSTGFGALPAGVRDQLHYQNFSIGAYFWSSTPNADNAYLESIRYSTADLFSSESVKTAGASVRCVKD